MSELHRPAANIRAEMARRNVRQIALAKHLGLSQTAISRRLNGEVEFSVAELVSVASLLGVPAAVLLDGLAAGDAA